MKKQHQVLRIKLKDSFTIARAIAIINDCNRQLTVTVLTTHCRMPFTYLFWYKSICKNLCARDIDI